MTVRLSVVVPTRNEADNVEPLVERLSRAIEAAASEVVFVDDSDDDTPAAVGRAAARSVLAVELVARRRGERSGGLGGAVLAGMRAARGEWVCVMDGDLQHPPERVPELLACARDTGADLVVASRLAPGGAVSGMSAGRVVVSRLLAWIVARLFGERLRGVSDPMTGFFLVRRAALDPDRLRPDGFKILLEILVSSPGLRVAEIPFRFEHRGSGRSKAGLREVLRLARALARLAAR